MPHARPALARRYAEALLESLDGREELERVQELLRELGDLWRMQPEVRRLFMIPTIPAAERVEAVASILMTDFPEPLAELLELVLKRGRYHVIPMLAEAFQWVIDDREGVVVVEVTSAVPLTMRQREQVIEVAGRMLAGAKFRLEEKVDPGLLGGVVLRLGDRRVDASLRGQLRRLVEEIVAAPIGVSAEQEGD